MDFVTRGGRRPAGFIPSELLDQVKIVDTMTVERIMVNDAWFEVALDDEWTAAYRVMPQNGRPVIGEVRVFPTESFESRNPGEWISGNLLGIRATVPAGGITTRLLRMLRTSETVAAGEEPWKKLFALIPKAQKQYSKWGFRTLQPKRRGGPRGWSDEQLLEAAIAYVEIGGRRPVAELAKRWKLKPTRARDLLQAATEKGFLTRGRQGIASRSLTERAKELLAERSQK